MGILNLTPDSFSDGGRWLAPERVATRVEELVAAGADLLDVGAESTRPGAQPVPAAEQLERLRPFLELLSEVPVPVSVDTRSAEVAAAALAAGVEVINDVSGGRHDPRIVQVVAERGAVLIAMHMRGTPADMDRRTRYDDLFGELIAEWEASRAAAMGAGIPRAHVWFDPGFGFAKDVVQSWRLAAGIERFRTLGVPIVVGHSRKRFVDVGGRPPVARDPATHALTALLAAAGVDVVRVHDVDGARQAVAVAERWLEAQR